MKRSMIIVLALVLTMFFLSASAMMQQNIQQPVAPDILPDAYISDSPLHKVILDAGEQQTYNTLREQGAIRNEINYGSFRMLVVDERVMSGGRAAVQSLAGAVQDNYNLIPINGYVLDTTNPAATYDQFPADLRKRNISLASANQSAPAGGLHLVQFVGPIQDEWLNTLRATGVEIVSYMPANAYVVRGNAKAARRLMKLGQTDPMVQFVGDYEPAFRLSPWLREMRVRDNSTIVDITVQVIDGPGAEQTIDNLKALATEFVQSTRVLNYHNVELKALAGQLARMAQYDDVFGIGERGNRRRMDEAQGQIVAGNLTGNSPTGPGYLAWLASKGFTSSQFTTFAVNVADDTYTLAGHPDLPASRVAFTNNPTNQTGVLGGHGFLNSHIIGGFNNGTGSAFEDALGFNYGLGIAPFARVGITAIFGNTAATGTTWESTAYGQGSRISSNSWGFQTNTGGPVPVYDASAQSYDAIVRDAQTAAGLQQLTVVFAAGNDGSGANTVSSPATAKNIICVGASENVRQTGTDGCGIANTGADSANDIISFSSRGPVNSTGGDGRIKPDIVAPGTHIEAGVPQSNYDGSSVCNQFFPAGQTLYGWSSGTSHSTPAVAGGAALVYQDFLNHSLAAPSPAMVKATLMNSAAYMSGTGAGGNLPSNSQGMGRMDLGRAFDSTARIRVDQTQVLGATGQTFQVTGTVSDTTKPFRVTLVWTDAPGPTTGAPWVNNLDLEVTVGGTTFKGNVFSGANSASGGTADTKNNAESVFLPAGTSGSFTITVKATNIAGDGVPGNADTTDQDFALVAYNAVAGVPTQPTIGVSPSSLSFSATAGGANPASQSLSITNTGAGTLNWTASANQTWLSVSPASGTAPSTATVSVNITGLAAGTYNGAITISATGATNTPVTVPVTLTVASGGGGAQQLLLNPGFESGNVNWTATAGVITNSASQAAHGGTFKAWLDGYGTTHTDSCFQTVTIPSTATSATLTFWLHIDSAETTTTTQFDKLQVQIRNTSNTVLSTLATYSNLNKAAGYSQKSFNLLAFKGQTIRVYFLGTEDSSLQTSFVVDDTALNVQ